MAAIPQRSQRTAFWPFILIGVGLIWLLSNAGILQAASIGVLFRLWPLILIIVGLDLLIGRQNPALGNLIGLIGVAVLLILMLIGPSIGLVRGVELKTAAYSEPRTGVETLRLDLEAGVSETTVSALRDSSELFTADLRYIGDIRYDVRDESGGRKVVTLANIGPNSFSFYDFGWFTPNDQQPRWTIGLNPDVPLDLDVKGGVGSINLDLSGLQVRSVQLSGGVGEQAVTLPSMPEAYTAHLSGGTGGMTVTILEGAALTLTLQGGVGEFVVDVPDGAGVRVDAQTGVGGVNIPGGYTVVRQTDQTVGMDGVWESPNYDSAERKIDISFDGGVGGFTLR